LRIDFFLLFSLHYHYQHIYIHITITIIIATISLQPLHYITHYCHYLLFDIFTTPLFNMTLSFSFSLRHLFISLRHYYWYSLILLYYWLTLAFDISAFIFIYIIGHYYTFHYWLASLPLPIFIYIIYFHFTHYINISHYHWDIIDYFSHYLHWLLHYLLLYFLYFINYYFFITFTLLFTLVSHYILYCYIFCILVYITTLRITLFLFHSFAIYYTLFSLFTLLHIVLYTLAIAYYFIY